MFTQKYRPSKSSEIIGNQSNIYNLIKWLNEWAPNNKNKCALLSGISGIGKTLTIQVVLKELKYNIVELNSDDERDKNYVNNKIKQFINIKTVFGEKNILVIEDLDCSSDYGFLSSIIEVIKLTNIPIISTCNDRYNPNLKSFVNYCYDIKFTKPPSSEILKFIGKIIKEEKIKISANKANELIENSKNDIRNILNNLQLISANGNSSSSIKNENNKDNSQLNLFEMTNIIMSKSYETEEKYKVFWLENDLIPLMIHENYVSNLSKTKTETENAEKLSNSIDSLCDSDIFESKIEMTNWELMPYVAYSNIKTTQNCYLRSKINFTKFLGNISKYSKNKKNNLDIHNKLTVPKINYLNSRLEYTFYVVSVLYGKLLETKTTKSVTQFVVDCYGLGLSKEDIQDNLFDLLVEGDKYKNLYCKQIDRKLKMLITKTFNWIEQ